MSDPVNTVTDNTVGAQSGANNTTSPEQVAGVSQPEGKPTNEEFYKGYSAGKKDLLAKTGYETWEQLKVKLESLKEVETTAQAKLLAESADKETLARKLQAAEQELTDLRGKATQLNTLRDTMLKDSIKNAGLEAGVRSDAVDLLIEVCRGSVSWTEDFKGKKVVGVEGKELPDLGSLMAEVKTSKPFLFAPTGRQGSGVIPRVVGDPIVSDNSIETPKFIPLSERGKSPSRR